MTINHNYYLDLAFQLIDLSEGDEVIIPSFTIISCLSAIIRAKAVPVFCDVDENSWNMTLEKVKEKTTDKTKAVLLVHLYGLTGEAEEISTYCNEKNIYNIIISANIEYDLSMMSDEEKKEYFELYLSLIHI